VHLNISHTSFSIYFRSQLR